MTPVLLSEDNLDVLKVIAKRACLAQAVRSAHITEALAYGLGFATQAALLAKPAVCQNSGPSWPISIRIGLS
ncbi:hypothetical protein J3A65_004626 [Rhizobium sp. PvP014]|nr:hypothetical protein [Rhizobium sp. PvP014]MBP2532024.1 hypothetical protein [Rhizobium sp. PvP099]